MPRALAARVALALAVVPAACGRADVVVSRAVADSSGVEVVSLERVPSNLAASHAWSLELLRSVGTAPADLTETPLLFDPRSMTRLADGTIVVADAGERPLAIIPSGRDTVSRAFSRLGQGPGEIYGGYPVLWPGPAGSFWVADRGNARVSRFDTTGAVLDERPLPTSHGGTSLGLVVQEPTGLLYSQQYTLQEGGGGRGAHGVAALDARTGELTPIVPLEQENDPPGTMVLWNHRALWTVLGDGSIVTGHDDSSTFRIWGGDGELRREVRVDLVPRAVGEEDRRRVLEELGRPASSVRLSDFFPFTDTYLPFSDSVFALRHTWVSHPHGDAVPEGVFAWRLVSSGGRYLGTLTYPEGFEPKWTDGTLMLGVLRDSLGVATIQEHRLVSPRARR